MKTLLMFLLLSPFTQLTNLANKSSLEARHEFTVLSKTEVEAKFNLTITGEVLNEKGEKTRFQLRKRNLKTPYRLALEQGQYKIVVKTKASNGAMVSKIQRIGSMTSASSDYSTARLEIKFSGDYSTTDVM